jgi:hypothetical protein
MVTSSPNEYKALTSDHLYNLLSQLSGEVQSDGNLQKRSSCRWMLRAPAELHFRGPDGVPVKEYVSVRDISLTGVGVLCKKQVPVGTTAEMVLPLEDGYYRVELAVAHCTQSIGGYNVGSILRLPDAPTMVPMITRALLTQEEFEQNSH